jgi:hypothetical protein
MPWRRRQVTHEETPPDPRGPVLWPWLLLLLLLVAGLIAAAVLLTGNDSKPRVPDVVGMNTPAAVRDLGQHGYAADVRSRTVAGTEAGKVLSQLPEAGSKLARGNRVTLVAGRGAVVSGVPDVVGLPSTRLSFGSRRPASRERRGGSPRNDGRTLSSRKTRRPARARRRTRPSC